MAEKQLKKLEKKGVGFLNTLDEDDLSNMIITANAHYYNKNAVISDSVYDILKEYIEGKFPENKTTQIIGAPIEKDKVTLPYEMWSQNKLKTDTNEFNNWFSKYTDNKVISTKLNGVSGLYTTEFDNKAQLFTRGNGKVGRNISHLIQYLNLPQIPGITIRGEFMISKENFKKVNKGEYVNSLGWLVGLINTQSPLYSKYQYLEFVAYEVIKPQLKPSDQMKWLKSHNLTTAQHKLVENITYSELSVLLDNLRDNYKYDIDGLIVTNDKIYTRKSENPKHAFAFKMILTDQIAEAKIIDVIWSPSKDGYLKPKVQFEPVIINGARLEFATAFNAAFVQDNKIGIGAIIKIIRSGEVIPYILDVTIPAIEGKMPDVPFKWTKTNTDIILKNPKNNEIVKEKNIVHFFTKLEVVGLSTGNVRRIITAGFDTVPKILQMTKDDFLTVEGFKEKMATKIFTDIKKKIKEASLARLMAATNLMGRTLGERRITMILSKYPNILTDTNKLEKVMEVDGFAEKTAKLFISNIPKFLDFLNHTKLLGIVNSSLPPPSNSNIVLSGFRSKEISLKIQEMTGSLPSNTVNKKTNLLIVKDKQKRTQKIIKAENLSIPILTIEEFKDKYMD